MKRFFLPASWDLEYDVSLLEKFKEAGGFWNHEEKLWCIDQEADIPERCQVYELQL